MSGTCFAGQEPGESFPLADSSCALLVASPAGQILDWSRADGGVHPTVAAEIACGVCSSMAMPLICKNAVVGVLRFGSHLENHYSPADIPAQARLPQRSRAPSQRLTCTGGRRGLQKSAKYGRASTPRIASSSGSTSSSAASSRLFHTR